MKSTSGTASLLPNLQSKLCTWTKQNARRSDPAGVLVEILSELT